MAAAGKGGEFDQDPGGLFPAERPAVRAEQAQIREEIADQLGRQLGNGEHGFPRLHIVEPGFRAGGKAAAGADQAHFELLGLRC